MGSIAPVIDQLIATLDAHPGVENARLYGSRARGDASPLSDWDIRIHERDFCTIAEDLPGIAAAFEPLAHQWDSLV